MNADYRPPLSRRQAIQRLGTGFGMLGLSAMLDEAGLMGLTAARASTPEAPRTPLAPRPPHFAPRAKRVIHIYLNGGPSQVDTFDPKPTLTRYDGRPLPQGNLSTEQRTGAAMGSPFKFRKYGESGLPISEIFERTAAHADDLCVIRSMQADTPNHEQSMRLMNCGDERLPRPSMGSWLTYGLGSENENLPAYVSMCPGLPVADVSNWRSAFLPGVYQGTYVDSRKEKAEDLIEDIRNARLSAREQRRQLDLLAEMNRRHRESRAEDDALDARIASFELAYRMQMEATDAFDVEQEPRHVRDMYGPGVQARQLLIARRLIERGVRFVQLFHGDVQPWDNHDKLPAGHRKLGLECDQGIAALLTDLKRRGLFEDTLVLCGGEFGRTPTVEMVKGKAGTGRDHNHWGFSVWLAGGGVKGGHIHGATDDVGYKAVESPVHIHDLHATILHLLGLDHTRLTYRHAGRDFRLTDVHGSVVEGILA
ncbi:DUF1501 domain-containing protein [Paludisphaera mucosa]|uniref:DUF1501 domain-containing protein n=1 Tax=Paludisphaera mucosa TaxID=3030827 RepID=A0ABT6FKZ6_9BACT|nr:DUF1501 domain-containing protein [Paludisphaera mucosa]MDG3008222.1 DUF1501 domain-containing protein [Paludisphaera mucosa]